MRQFRRKRRGHDISGPMTANDIAVSGLDWLFAFPMFTKDPPNWSEMMNISKRGFIGLLAAVPVAGLVAWSIAPQASAAAKTYTEGGVAIDGTDTVAYFTQGKPVPGKREFSQDWNGATWLFSTAENRDTFAASPAKYAPQYGGYCAYAVSEGYTASTVPEAWKIVDGKLYLNYSTGVQRTWEKNYSERIVDGDKNWPKIVSGG